MPGLLNQALRPRALFGLPCHGQCRAGFFFLVAEKFNSPRPPPLGDPPAPEIHANTQAPAFSSGAVPWSPGFWPLLRWPSQFRESPAPSIPAGPHVLGAPPTGSMENACAPSNVPEPYVFGFPLCPPLGVDSGNP